jgi:hypothetical protein
MSKFLYKYFSLHIFELIFFSSVGCINYLSKYKMYFRFFAKSDRVLIKVITFIKHNLNIKIAALQIHLINC